MTENEQAAQGILALLDFTYALTGLGGGAVVLIVLGLVFKGIKGNLQEGTVSKEELENVHIDLKKEIQELQDYIMRIDKKEQKTRGAVMKMAGNIDIDLPELAD